MKRYYICVFSLMMITGLLVQCDPGQDTEDGKLADDKQNPNINELIRSARDIRELLWQDPHRPRYHLMPPEGYFNDANGALYWKGRYHMFYLGRTTIPDPDDPDKEKWVALWDHVCVQKTQRSGFCELGGWRLFLHGLAASRLGSLATAGLTRYGWAV